MILIVLMILREDMAFRKRSGSGARESPALLALRRA
jgi:hypothetical protein